jgi:acyl carrier protein
MEKMEKQEFLLLLDEVFEVPQGTLQGFEVVRSLENWDSLMILSLMALVDEKFGLTLEADDVNRCVIVDDFVGLLGNRISDSASAR